MTLTSDGLAYRIIDKRSRQIRGLGADAQALDDELRRIVDSTLTSLSWNPISRAEKFDSLCSAWEEETTFISDATEMAMHPAYQQIIGMGPVAMPFILERLVRAPEHWFWALRAITGENPVAEEHQGDIEAMAQAWIDWARARGLLEHE